MSQKHFSMMPNIAIPRTKMDLSFDHKTSFNFGKLIPIDCIEVLPGDTFKYDMAALIRMSTPIAPILDNIRGSVHAFFVPMRLVWEHTEEFYGANKTSAGPQTNTYIIPSLKYGLYSDFKASVGSVSDYLGKPVVSSTLTNGPEVSVLKERCYWLIWSEWYRAQQVQAPYLIDRGDIANIGSLGGVALKLASMPADVCKPFDYFTAATLYPQYGAAVTLPLGAYAPIVSGNDLNLAGEGIHSIDKPYIGYSGATAGSTVPVDSHRSTTGSSLTTGNLSGAGAGTQPLDETNLFADLSNATAATVNTLRYAFAVQKYLERSNFGSRFFEMLNAHYGVTSPDARLQRPEHLGEMKFDINIQQVLSTADYSTGATTKVGQPGANSVTGFKGHLFRKAFVEPGYVMILLSTYQDHTYAQGLLREDLRQSRYEFYSPEFANLGDQAIFKNEIRVDSNQVGQVFGYQEHWAEYRYRPNRVSGLLNPNVSGSLDYWTLAEKFATSPTLSDSFIKENRDNIQRALTTGSSGPDFIGDFYFKITAVRPMPAYTIPGLIDHFGTN